MKCSIEYCSKEAIARNYCHSHYRALMLYGDPEARKQVQHHGKTLTERFFAYVKKTDNCWLWVGYRDPNGYGRMNYNGGPKLASRLSWMIHHGSLPEGSCVCHKCDNPQCVNPDHLFVGSQADNMADMTAKGRARKRGLKGEQHNLAKLTESAVRKIRSSKKSAAEIAEEFGVSRTTVYDVRNRRIWTHID